MVSVCAFLLRDGWGNGGGDGCGPGHPRLVFGVKQHELGRVADSHQRRLGDQEQLTVWGPVEKLHLQQHGGALCDTPHHTGAAWYDTHTCLTHTEQYVLGF